jgi:signal transduction histidine kinase/CheY-like chemotaxis protein
MSRGFLLIAVLYTAVPAEVAAQSPASEPGRPYYVERFGPSDYGQNEQNWAVLQDDGGRIFVANRTAVLEFDGKEWRSHLIPNQFARSLALGPDGAVCVGGVGEIGCLRPDSVGALHYESLLPFIPEADRGFRDVWTAHSLPDGVYFQTFNRVFRWDGHAITVWETATRFHKAFAVRSRYFVRDEGLGLLEMRGDRLVPVPAGEMFTQERIDAMLPAGETDVVIVTRNRGFLRWDGSAFSQDRSEIETLLDDDRVYHGVALSNSKYALGTISGRVVIARDNGEVITVVGAEVGLQPDEIVLDLYQDHQGALWLALDTGILRVDALTPLTFFDQAQGLEGAVYHIARYGEDLYISTSQGLYRQRPGTGLEVSARFERVANLGQQIWHTLMIEGRLLVATNDGVHEVLPGGNTRLVLEERAFAMRESWNQPNAVYVGLANGLGLLQAGSSGWEFEQILSSTEIGQVRSITERLDGSVWAGTLSGGVLRAWREENGTYRYELIGTDHGLPAGPSALHSGVDNQLYILQRDGVYSLVSEEPLVFARDGRFDDIMNYAGDGGYLINAAEKDRMWVMSSGKISAYMEQGGSFVDITPPALVLGNVPARFLYLENDGVIWVAVEQGLLRYDPLVEKDYGVSFPALIRSVSTNGIESLFAGSAGRHFDPPQLSFANNRLRFEVAATSFNDRAATEYQFWLEGFEDGWSEWSRETFKEYTNLTEGRYRFHVRARNAHGVVSTVDTFAFTVLPPWYRSWWAYLLYGMVAVFVIWGYSRWRLSEHLIEMERDRRVRKELEVANARLIEANERLHEADRLKDDLLANTSHELRTPLTAILGFAAVLYEELSGDRREFADHIQRSGKRLLQTVDALLDMARLQADTMDLEPEELDITQLVREVSNDFEAASREKNLLLKVLPETMPLRVCIDRDAITTILTNLIGNAVKFTDKGDVTVLVDADEEKIYLTVRDTGIGITQEFLPQLFTPFKQASAGYGRAYEGTGVGLAVTHRLVQLLGGQIEVETEAGNGSCFRVSLPRYAHSYRIAGTKSREVGRLEGRKLLLVTDPERPEHILRSALRSLTEVAVAEGADEAVARLRSSSYDLVLIDTQLRCSDLGGTLMALRLESRSADAAYVAVGSAAAPGDRERFLQMGFDGHIGRPFTRSRLLTVLEAVVNQELAD